MKRGHEHPPTPKAQLPARETKRSPSKLASLGVVCSAALGVGCSHHGTGPASAGHRELAAEHGNHQAHGGHGHHPFAHPERLAARWNDPKRDEWQKPQEITAALALEPGQTVADIGAGTGYMVAHLSRAVGERGKVIAIDAEAAMIDYLEAHRRNLGPARIVSRKVGTDSPGLKKDSVDGVLTLDTWHHIGGREAYAREVHAGLKRGGRFVVVDHDLDAETGPPKAMRLTPTQVAKELSAAGFRVELVPESMPRHFMVVGHKV